MNHERYLFSIFLDSGSDDEECDVHLVITTDESLRYMLRLTSSFDETFTYQDVSTFTFPRQLIEMLGIRSVFILRATRNPQKNVAMFRIYVRSALEMNTQHVLENEQSLVNLIDENIGRIVVEPFFVQQTKKTKLDKISFASYKNSLSQEQRTASQEMADSIHLNPLLNIRNSLYCKTYTVHNKNAVYFNLQNLSFQETPLHPMNWKPEGGFLLYTKGGGRRRTISSYLNALSTQEIKKETTVPFSHYYAHSSSVVVCEEEEIKKWLFELNPEKTTVLNSEKDFDDVTFEKLNNGVTILMTIQALNKLDLHASEMIKDFALIKREAEKNSVQINNERLQRLFMSVSSRVSNLVAPIAFVKFRCVIIDDGIDPSCIMRKEVLQKISRIKSDWKWICLGYEGVIPQKMTPDQLYHFSSILNIPTDACLMNNSFNSKSQLNPEFWKMIHEHPKFIIRLKTPKVITRRVCLIEVAVSLNENEKDYIEFLKKFRYQDIFSMLLGSNIDGVSGSKTSTILERKEVMTLEEALKNCEDHFKDGGGTFAQKMQQKFYDMNSQTSDKNFIIQILNKSEKICQICSEENEEMNVTLCGHLYCTGCLEMQRGNKEIMTCPMCRASLSKFDAYRLTKSSKKTCMLSKINFLKSTLQTIFSKRRYKKRLAPSIWIFCPEKLIQDISHQIEDETYDIFLDLNQESTKPKVFVMGFSEIKNYTINENVDGVFFVCPPVNKDNYHQLIRKSYERESPVNLYLFAADAYESFDDAKEIFSKCKSID